MRSITAHTVRDYKSKLWMPWQTLFGGREHIVTSTICAGLALLFAMHIMVWTNHTLPTERSNLHRAATTRTKPDVFLNFLPLFGSAAGSSGSSPIIMGKKEILVAQVRAILLKELEDGDEGILLSTSSTSPVTGKYGL